MPFNQKKFKSLADRLLKKNSMGEVTITRVTTIPAANSWDEPEIVQSTNIVDAVAFGVASKYIDNVTILATDLTVTMAVPSQYAVGDIINIDGSPITIIESIPVPAAGDPAFLKFIVRG